TSIDYAAWAAVRSVAEAVTRTKSSDTAAIRSYLFSDEFSLAGFKGSRLTYRRWNGQLRQPIPLAHPDAIVAAAPIEGFLHRQTELDTLGLDQPESKCKEMN
ncbi:MAG: branched-chain amino acid ABC transporter substrate-binding protein, partial [Burkholderiaceae bacterium]